MAASSSSSYEDEEIQLKPYQLLDWRPGDAIVKGRPFNMIVAGPTKSGKSVVIRDLYVSHWERQFDLVVIFSRTINTPDAGFEFIETDLRFSEWDPDVIDSLRRVQTKLVDQGFRQLRILVIIDDMMGTKMKQDTRLLDLFTLGRHWGMSICYSCQYIMYLNIAWRMQCQYLILMKQRILAGSEKVTRHFLGGLANRADLKQARAWDEAKFMMKLYDDNTEDYHAFVVDYTKLSARTSVKDVCYRYLAALRPKPHRRREPKRSKEISEAMKKLLDQAEVDAP